MQILDMEATWLESEPRTPLVCILSIGSDPTTQIATLAKNKTIGNRQTTTSFECTSSPVPHCSLEVCFNGPRSRISCPQNDDGLYGRRRMGAPTERAFIIEFLLGNNRHIGRDRAH